MEETLGETAEIRTGPAPGANAPAQGRGAEIGDPAGHWHSTAPLASARRARSPRRSPRCWQSPWLSLLYCFVSFAAFRQNVEPPSATHTIGESRPSTPGTATATPSCRTRTAPPTTVGTTWCLAFQGTVREILRRSHGECGEDERTTSAPARCPSTTCRTTQLGPLRRCDDHGRDVEVERSGGHDGRAPPRGRGDSWHDTRRSRTTMARTTSVRCKRRAQGAWRGRQHRPTIGRL